MNDNCLFCKIARKEVPAKILYEDDDILVMLDAFPDTDGHTLIIPKKHYDDIYEVPNDILIKMFLTSPFPSVRFLPALRRTHQRTIRFPIRRKTVRNAQLF